jgi:hypothetical protein
MIPAFPLDGGRVFRAFLGFFTTFQQATQVAATVGRVLAIGLGLVAIFSGQIWLAYQTTASTFGGWRNPPTKKISRRDLTIVKAQRESRGTLFDWIFESFEGVSDDARMTLYEHAHQYQDGLLDVIIGTYADLEGRVPEMVEVVVPSFCEAGAVKACAVALKSQPRENLAASIESYRKKAIFAYTVGEQLDNIQDPNAKAYMTCRAAISAKDDFDMTPEDKRPGGTEERRRNRDFFRVDATVGMELSPQSASTR